MQHYCINFHCIVTDLIYIFFQLKNMSRLNNKIIDYYINNKIKILILISQFPLFKCFSRFPLN